jgi:hypothetical protein
MLITQYNKRSKMISASLMALVPGLKTSAGKQFQFNSDIDSQPNMQNNMIFLIMLVMIIVYLHFNVYGKK